MEQDLFQLVRVEVARLRPPPRAVRVVVHPLDCDFLEVFRDGRPDVDSGLGFMVYGLWFWFMV